MINGCQAGAGQAWQEHSEYPSSPLSSSLHKTSLRRPVLLLLRQITTLRLPFIASTYSTSLHSAIPTLHSDAANIRSSKIYTTHAQSTIRRSVDQPVHSHSVSIQPVSDLQYGQSTGAVCFVLYVCLHL